MILLLCNFLLAMGRITHLHHIWSTTEPRLDPAVAEMHDRARRRVAIGSGGLLLVWLGIATVVAFTLALWAGLMLLVITVLVAAAAYLQARQDARAARPVPPIGVDADFGDSVSEDFDRRKTLELARWRWTKRTH
jgi:hypothetical protein